MADEKQNAAGDLLALMLVSLAQWLVDDPLKIVVQSNTSDGVVMMHIQTAPADTGKLIGKKGRTARSIRTILSAAGMKFGVRTELNIDGFRQMGGDDAERAG